MKKNFKLVLALILALMMVMGMTSAMADVTIKINHADGYTPDTNTAPETYHAYKIFDAVTPSTYTGVTDTNVETAKVSTVAGFKYTMASNSAPWYDAVKASGFFDESVQTDGTVIFTLKESKGANAETAKAIAAALKPYTKDVNATSGIGWDYALTLDEASTVANGYYLIVSSLGEKLVLATSNIEITEKNNYPSIDKEEKDEDKTDYIDDGLGANDPVDVKVGDTIQYKVEVVVPATANSVITVTDTMSAGLEYAGALSATIGSTAYDGFTTVAKGASDTWDWKVTIPADSTTKGNTIVFTFSATVTADAIKDTGKKNDVTLEYSNFKQEDSVPYEMVNAGIHKYDGNTNADLAGVEFKLVVKGSEDAILVTKHDDGYYYPDTAGSAALVTDANGKITIRGLDKDKAYQLIETKELPGYNKLTAPVDLTLTVDTDGTVDPTFVEVENNKGAELPSTGGVGTTIFYVAGSILVLAAAILLITKRRMSNND